MSNSFLTNEELQKMGFGFIGKNLKISRNAIFYTPENIYIGDNSRIDDLVVISAPIKVKIGRYVHISLGVSILGKGQVTIEDFVSISVKTSIFTSNDDYSGENMTNPTIPSQFTKVTTGNVLIRKHAIIGAHSIILPNSELGTVSAFGAFSLISGKYAAKTIYAGIPAKKINTRSSNLENLEKILLNNN